MMNRHWCTALFLSCVLSACGGGDSSGDGVVNPTPLPTPGSEDDLYDWEQGVYYASNLYKDQCENPRTGNNPFNGNQPYPDEAGAYFEENFWLRSWINELYLWYDEVDDLNPYQYQTEDYFERLKTDATTPSGAAKDKFHFTWDTFDYLTTTVSGVSFGYGMQLAFLQSTPPREVRVYDVVPGSPAELAGVERGMKVVTIDGVDMISGIDVDTLNAGIYPSEEYETHQFTFQSYSEESLEVSLTSASIAEVPVKYVTTVQTPSGDVGYIHFNSHNYPSEAALYDAFASLIGIEDLVLDLRYNGGGLLDVAGQVSYMIAGNSNTDNLDFYEQRFNDKHPTRNPVTGQILRPIPFHKRSLGFSDGLQAGASLPSLNLSRVYILSTADTCSASEAVINGLRGAGVEVYLIGETTCGKPYGFYPQDNCGTTYFTIQFTGVNNDGFGEYFDGFSPANEPNAPGVSVPGCYVEDDFTKQLGDSEEAMFAAALQLRATGQCPTVMAKKERLQKKSFARYRDVNDAVGKKAIENNMYLRF